MSGVDINAIREAIAAQIASHVPAVHCYAYDPGDSVNYPCAIVYPAGGPGGEFIGYQQTFGPRGIAGVEMAVEVRVTAPDPVAAQKAMGALVSTGNPGSMRGVAEEAPGAYKDVEAVAMATEQAGLARRVASLRPLICIKG